MLSIDSLTTHEPREEPWNLNHGSQHCLGGLFDELQGVDTDWTLGFAVNCILSGAPKVELCWGMLPVFLRSHVVNLLVLDVGMNHF